MSNTNLVKRYIYAVTRRIPEDQREDVADELRATIEDILEDKGSRSEKNIKDVLASLGDPDALAGRYKGSKQYLIGPDLYPSYIRALRLAAAIGLPIALGINLIAQLVAGIQFGGVIGTTVGVLIGVAAHIGFWTTLVFFIIERTHSGKKEIQEAIGIWTPDMLPELPAKHQIPISEGITDLVTYAFLAGLPLFAQTLFGDHGEGAFTPLFNPAIWAWTPIIIALGVLGVLKTVLKLYKRNWTPLLTIFNVLFNGSMIAGLILLYNTTEIINPAIVEVIKANTTNVENIGTVIHWSVLISVIVTVGIYAYDAVASVVRATQLKRRR